MNDSMKKSNLLGYSYDIDGIVEDIFSTRHQKSIDMEEHNSKTLAMLNEKLLEKKNINRKLFWLDVGCGNGRCLKSIDVLERNGNLYEQKLINYIGIDISRKCMVEAKSIAKLYYINHNMLIGNAKFLYFSIKFDIISAILLLHEIDPIDLPYILNNLLKMLNEDGKLIISDFNDPMEREPGIIVWDVADVNHIVENVGGVIVDLRLENSSFDPESRFYSLCIKNSKRKHNFKKFMKLEYFGFLDDKVNKLEFSLMNHEDKIRTSINKKLGKDRNHIPTIDERIMLRRKKLNDIFLLFRKRELIKDQLLYLQKRIRNYRSSRIK